MPQMPAAVRPCFQDALFSVVETFFPRFFAFFDQKWWKKSLECLKLLRFSRLLQNRTIVLFSCFEWKIIHCIKKPKSTENTDVSLCFVKCFDVDFSQVVKHLKLLRFKNRKPWNTWKYCIPFAKISSICE